MDQDQIAWVFVSHASADLARVREVRNFLEKNGAGPILFHLRSMTRPKQFWPLIEQEIASRNFFLLCDSVAAQRSEWVQRERRTVERIRKRRPIRVGRINVDDDLDLSKLKRFTENLSAYVVHPADVRAKVITDEIRSQGFVANSWGTNSGYFGRLQLYETVRDDFRDMMRVSANKSWLVLVLNNELASSLEFRELLPGPAYRNRFMVILTEKITTSLDWLKVSREQIVDGSTSIAKAARTAGHRMLTLNPE